MRRRYAERTAVPVSRSRAEIDAMLRAWECSGIGWHDNFETGEVELLFRWSHEGVVYHARFTLILPSDDLLRDMSVDGRNGRFSPSKFEQEKRDRGKSEHRVLALWLKAALNAVELGLVEPAEKEA